MKPMSNTCNFPVPLSGYRPDNGSYTVMSPDLHIVTSVCLYKRYSVDQLVGPVRCMDGARTQWP